MRGRQDRDGWACKLCRRCRDGSTSPTLMQRSLHTTSISVVSHISPLFTAPIVQGDLCRACAGISAEWNYVTAIPSQPSLACLLYFACMLAIPIICPLILIFVYICLYVILNSDLCCGQTAHAVHYFAALAPQMRCIFHYTCEGE